jgi:hypothetical protein
MRAFVQRPLAFLVVSLAAVPSGRALAQSESAPLATDPAEQTEEITVRGRKTRAEYRLELERAKEDIVEIFNRTNRGETNDVTCRDEQPTGSRMRHNVCRSNAEQRASANAAQAFLNSLFVSSAAFRTNAPNPPPGGPPVNAIIDTAEAQADGETQGKAAKAAFEAEMERLMGQNRQLFRAVTKYVELREEYNQAGGESAESAE